MHKISQKEILGEGFFDTIRKITSPIAKTVAGVAGAAKGIAKVVAPNLSREIGSDIDKLKSIGKGTSDAFNAQKNKQINSTPGRFLENELKTKWDNIFNTKSVKIIKTKQDNKLNAAGSQQKKTTNRSFVYFEAEKYKQIGGVENKEQFIAIVTKGKEGFALLEITDSRGIIITRSNRNRNYITPNTAPTTISTGNKPKFFEALRTWKINNIGPNAATVGITYQQTKEFLKSLGVKDANRVLKSVNIQDKGSTIISNIKLNNLQITLKSRGIVSEKSQIITLTESNSIIN